MTSEEIAATMDFEKVMKTAGKRKFSKRVKWASGIGIVLVGTLLVVLFLPSRSVPDPVLEQPETVEQAPDEILNENEPSSSPESSSELPEEAPAEREELPETPVEQPVEKVTIQPETEPAVVEEEEEPEETTTNSNLIIEDVYVEAMPVEGYDAFYEFINNELTYPPLALEEGLTGFVEVSFLIDTLGKPANILIEKSMGELFDNEAVRVIRRIKPWKPASFNGKPVESRRRLKLFFELED